METLCFQDFPSVNIDLVSETCGHTVLCAQKIDRLYIGKSIYGHQIAKFNFSQTCQELHSLYMYSV